MATNGSKELANNRRLCGCAVSLVVVLTHDAWKARKKRAKLKIWVPRATPSRFHIQEEILAIFSLDITAEVCLLG